MTGFIPKADDMMKAADLAVEMTEREDVNNPQVARILMMVVGCGLKGVEVPATQSEFKAACESARRIIAARSSAAIE